MEILDARVKQKTGTAADFAGFTLLEGEFALVRSSADGPVINYKVGPGVFEDLPWSLQVPGSIASVSPSTDFNALPAGLYLPDADGTYDGTVPVDLTEGVTYLNWDGSTLTKQVYPINLSGYVATSDINTKPGGKNMANPGLVQLGIIDSDGNLADTSNPVRKCMVGIPVAAGNQYTISGMPAGANRYVAFWNASNTVVGSVTAATAIPYTVTAPVGATQMSFNVRVGEPNDSLWINTLQVEEGATATAYEPFSPYVSGVDSQPVIAKALDIGNNVPDPVDPNNAVNLRTLGVNTVLNADLEFESGANLFNTEPITRNGDWSSGGLLYDYYVNNENGLLIASPGWVTAIVPVLPNTAYTFGRVYPTPNAYSAYWSNQNGDSITWNGAFASGQTRTYTSPANAAYLLVSVARPVDSPTAYSQGTINQGGTLLSPYEPYRHVLVKIKGAEIKSEVPPSVVIPKQRRFAKVQLPNRKATITIIHDDGNTSDALVKAILDEYGFKCGFALMSTNTRIDEYLGYQDDGFEILSHSTDSDPMQTPGQAAVYEPKMWNSYRILKSYGFDVSGWVTPNSALIAEYKPLIKKYYGFAFVNYINPVTGGAGTVNDGLYQFLDELRDLGRVSMQSNDLVDLEEIIDNVIATDSFCVLYGHALPDTDLDEAKYRALLDYIKAYSDAGTLNFLPPSEAINNYYSFGHEELLTLV